MQNIDNMSLSVVSHDTADIPTSIDILNHEDINKYLSNTNILNIIVVKDINDILNNYFINIDVNNRHYYCNSLDNIKYDIFQNYELYMFLINCINFANNIINQQQIYDIDKLLLYSHIWKIFIYDNMMWNLPFTLNDIIFIPISYIKSSYNNNSYRNFTKTIIHERIHISQRKNINLWNNYIKNNDLDKWIMISKNDILFNFIKNYNYYQLFNNIIIINPDSFYDDFTYLYKYNNELYYGLFVLDNNHLLMTLNSPIIKWLKIINIDNNFYFEKVNLDINNTEHPFEHYAYKLSDDYIIKTQPELL